MRKNYNDETSKAGHEKSCLNMGGPSSKAKYSWETDSEPVPWGKGEKNPKKGSEKNLKPYAYKRSEFRSRTGWRRAFCIMSLRVTPI